MDTYDLDIFMLVLFSQIKILCHPQIKYLQLSPQNKHTPFIKSVPPLRFSKILNISCTKNSQIFLGALFFLPKSQIIDTY